MGVNSGAWRVRYKGHVIIGGHRFEVHDVLLANGKIEVHFYIYGPMAPFSGPITVFGQDGQGVLQGKTFAIDEGIPARTRWDFQYGMIVGPVDTGGEVRHL